MEGPHAGVRAVAGVVLERAGDELGCESARAVSRSVPHGADGAGGRGPGVQSVLHPGLQQLHRGVSAAGGRHAQQLLLLAERDHAGRLLHPLPRHPPRLHLPPGRTRAAAA